MKKLILATLASLIVGTSVASAAGTPMLKPYVNNWNYGSSDERLTGYIPALSDTVTRPWELDQWTGVFTYPNGKSTTISNYDVFNVKRNADDLDFDKENGFGLVYKSPAALGTLFDSITKNLDVEAKQLKYYRDSFTEAAEDPDYKFGNSFYYNVQGVSFLRVPGVIQRLGAKFDSTKKISENGRQALYTVSDWPVLNVTMGQFIKYFLFYINRDAYF